MLDCEEIMLFNVVLVVNLDIEVNMVVELFIQVFYVASDFSVVDGVRVMVGIVFKDCFELVELFGWGGMGMVYWVWDLCQVEVGDFDFWIVVKVINESFFCYECVFIVLQQEMKKI